MTEIFGKVAIKWLGHACFLIMFSGGVKVITDPFNSAQVGYREIAVAADAVTVSHHHFDHDAVGVVTGSPVVIQDLKRATIKKKVTVFGVESLHYKDEKDKARGKNTIYVIEGDGLRIVHLGDLGRTPTPDQIKKIGRVDVLLIPVGGFYTMGLADAAKVVEQLKPKIVVPMHYGKNGQCKIKELAGVDDFLKGKKNVVSAKGRSAAAASGVNVNGDTLEIDPKNLPKTTTIYVPSYK